MIRYEKAQPADIPGVADMYQAAFPEALLAVFGKDRLPTSIVNDLFLSLYRHEPSGFIVARQEDRMAGFVIVSSDRQSLWQDLVFGGMFLTLLKRWAAGRYRGLGLRFVPRLAKLGWDYWRAEKNPGANDPSTAQILSIVVGGSFQRQGIGLGLTEKGLDYLRTTSAKIVRLEVDAAKEAPVRLYLKMRFKEIARLPTPRGPALVMTLPLK